jgi:hypothetical protein
VATSETVLPEHAATPAHRDGNVLRWLTAYTFSLVGDSVYFVALGWSPRRQPVQPKSASSWPPGRYHERYSCSLGASWPTGSTPAG